MKPLLYTLFILFCCSCTAPSRLETALRQSGSNRPELEKEAKVESTAVKQMREEVKELVDEN